MTSISKEDQTKGQIGKTPSLGHFMDLSKDKQSPMIIKKGDNTPSKVSVGSQETLFTYLQNNKIPFDEDWSPKEVLEDLEMTIAFQQNTKTGGNNRAELAKSK